MLVIWSLKRGIQPVDDQDPTIVNIGVAQTELCAGCLFACSPFVEGGHLLSIITPFSYLSSWFYIFWTVV